MLKAKQIRNTVDYFRQLSSAVIVLYLKVRPQTNQLIHNSKSGLCHFNNIENTKQGVPMILSLFEKNNLDQRKQLFLITI